MKKFIFIICCLFAVACRETTKKSEFQKVDKNAEKTENSTKKLCFLSLVGKTEIQGEMAQDSLILRLNINGNHVTGTYDWVPVEKDSRRGEITAKKEGPIVRGYYNFQQEGKNQIQPIQIEFDNNVAKVSTNLGEPDAMVVKIEKTDCW